MTEFPATDANFEKEVIEKSKAIPVVVDFWATWCMACRVLSPTIQKVAKDFEGKLVLAVVNVDENPNLSSAFGIRSIPTIILFKDGKQVDGFTGALAEPMIHKWLEKNGIRK